MQAIRNGVKTTLRTPGKTGLFTAILLALAMLTSVAFCVFAAVRIYLKDCDAYYHTVATLEYMGEDYPNETVWDESEANAVAAHADALTALGSHESAVRFTPAQNTAAAVAGRHRTDPFTYDVSAAVLRVRVRMRENMTESYIAEVTEAIYACREAEGKLLLLRTDTAGNPDAPQPEAGGDYLVCGHFFSGQNGYMWFLAEQTPFYENGEQRSLPPFTAFSEAARAQYEALAGQIELRNDLIPLQRTPELPDVLPFHQQMLTVEQGRYFTAEEYETEAHVCVITGRMARTMELEPGSNLDLNIYSCDGDLYAAPHSPYAAGEYEVIGITGADDRYPYTIYLPSAQTGGDVTPVNGYLLGQYRLKNTGAAGFLAAAAPLEEYGFRVTVYDQGYFAAVEPMREMLLISAIFLAVCLALAAAVMCLTCHVFVSRQREAAATMLALGSGRRHIHLYFLSAVLVPALPGTLLGCALGRAVQGGVIRLLGRFAARLNAQDLRFSATRMAAVRTLDFSSNVPGYVYAAVALALVAGALLLTLAFSRGNFRIKKKKRPRPNKAMLKAGRSSRYTGKLKYALLSIRRRRGGTAAVLLLGITVSLFFGILVSSMEGYRAQLAAVTREAVITGHATDAAGRETVGMALPERFTEYAVEAGLFENYNLTYVSSHLRFLGVAETARGVVNELPEPDFPESSFALETLFAQMSSEPAMHKTNDLRTSPLFYYTPLQDLTFAEGWDVSVFAGDERVCALPEKLMDAYGLQPGDTARFLFTLNWRGMAVVDYVDLKVIASYVSAAESSVIFAPVGCRYLQTRIGWLDPDDAGTCSGFVFTLKNAADLPLLRQALDDAGFSPVNGSARGLAYAVIDDETYLNTTRSMERQIRYVGLLYGALYALAIGLAAVLAWLMTAARRQEIALMRALGTQKRRIVLTFTAEQLILCAAGVLAGLGLRACFGGVLPAAALLSAAFFAVWTLSAGLQCAVCVKKQAYAALTEPE